MLSTAITWSKNRDSSQYPVLLLEKQPIVGGMVTSFKRKGFIFDTAQLVPDPLELFKYLEIDCELIKFKNYFSRIFLVNGNNATEIRIPSGYNEFREMLLDRYPSQKKSINRFSLEKCLMNSIFKVEPTLSIYYISNVLFLTAEEHFQSISENWFFRSELSEI